MLGPPFADDAHRRPDIGHRTVTLQDFETRLDIGDVVMARFLTGAGGGASVYLLALLASISLTAKSAKVDAFFQRKCLLFLPSMTLFAVRARA